MNPLAVGIAASIIFLLIMIGGQLSRQTKLLEQINIALENKHA
jgi:hypothetical protein